jgi:hypothetical protein
MAGEFGLKSIPRHGCPQSYQHFHALPFLKGSDYFSQVNMRDT